MLRGVEVDVVSHLEGQVHAHLGLRNEVGGHSRPVGDVCQELGDPGARRAPCRGPFGHEGIEGVCEEVADCGQVQTRQVEHGIADGHPYPGGFP